MKYPLTVSDARYHRAALLAEDQIATSFSLSETRSIQSSRQAPDGCRKRQVWFGRTLSWEQSVTNFSLFIIHTYSENKQRVLGEAGEPPSEYELDHYERETSYTISPAPWLIRLGFQYGLHCRWLSSSSQGWKNSLETIRPVPDDALIFDFCKTGNLPAVQKLLSSGHASVRDTDSRGYTPLHVRLYSILISIPYTGVARNRP